MFTIQGLNTDKNFFKHYYEEKDCTCYIFSNIQPDEPSDKYLADDRIDYAVGAYVAYRKKQPNDDLHMIVVTVYERSYFFYESQIEYFKSSFTDMTKPNWYEK